jgi:hypothetical protein
VPEIIYGSKPVDAGNLTLSDDEKEQFLKDNPAAAKFVRPFIGSNEFINGISRWCLWLTSAAPQEVRSIAGLKSRVEAVRDFRLASKKEPTRRKAETPTLFAEIRQPSSDYLLIPSVSFGTTQVCSHRLHFTESRREQSRHVHSRCGTFPLRSSILSDAHGVGPPSLWTFEVGFPLFEQTRLQQFSMA